MPTTRQRRIICSPDISQARTDALLEHIEAYEKVHGDRGITDIDVLDPDEDEDEDMVDVKGLVSRLGNIGSGIEFKDIVRTPKGAAFYDAPIGSVIGKDGKVVKRGRGRPRDNEPLPIAHHKVQKVKVERAARGNAVTIHQQTSRGTFMTNHPNMASADEHIDAILERHEHLQSIHHQHGGHEIEVHHNGDLTENGEKIGKVKRGEKLADALDRVNTNPEKERPDLSDHTVSDLKRLYRTGSTVGLSKRVFADELRRRGYRQHPLTHEWNRMARPGKTVGTTKYNVRDGVVYANGKKVGNVRRGESSQDAIVRFASMPHTPAPVKRVRRGKA